MINEMLDSMTAAVEAGLGTPATFFKDFFATEQDVQNFADALDDYSAEGTFWVNDRHFNAFLHATNASEENAVTYSAMADCIRAMFDVEREKAKKAAKPTSKKNLRCRVLPNADGLKLSPQGVRSAQGRISEEPLWADEARWGFT